MDENGRHEIKHHISRADRLILMARLPRVMKPDEFSSRDGGYRVRSLYFDDYNDTALNEKLAGVDNREKFRLRLYNGDASFIRLEKKSKRAGLCYKEKAAISREACDALIGGDYSVLKEAGELPLELYAKMRGQNLRPKIIVDYWREAYVYPACNARVTVDSDLRSSSSLHAFTRPQLAAVPAQSGCILEVKFDGFLPDVIRALLSPLGREPSSFSKYAATRMT